MTPEIGLARLTVAEVDALILSLLPLVGQLEAALARIAELEARLALLKKPPTTPDNSSLPPSKGQKANDQATGKKPSRKSRHGFGRALDPNPDRVVDRRLDACPRCQAAWPAEQTPQQVYDRIELPPVKPHVIRVRLFGGCCACCGERAVATAPEGLEPGSPSGKSIEAIAVYLHYAQAISIERLLGLFAEKILYNDRCRRRSGNIRPRCSISCSYRSTKSIISMVGWRLLLLWIDSDLAPQRMIHDEPDGC